MAYADDSKKQLWEVRFKGMNYLLIAHGAGLVACLTLLKDYDTTPTLKGVGVFVWLFGLGLITAIFAAVSLYSLGQAELVGRAAGPWKRRVIALSLTATTLLLIAAIVVSIWKFGRL